MLCLALFVRDGCLVKTGKTGGLFCKTDICYEVWNMHICCIRFSNRYLYWPNRELIGPTNLDKTGFVILSRKGNGVWANIYLFETFKSPSLCSHQKPYTMSVWPNRASVLLNRVSVSSKWRLTLSKKDLYLYQTEPLFELNRASVYVWVYYSYSLCGYVWTLLYTE